MICITRRLGAWEPERATLEGKRTGGDRAAAEGERASARVLVREPGGGWGEGPAWLEAALRNLEERWPREAGDARRVRWQSAVSAAAPGPAGCPEPPREQGCLCASMEQREGRNSGAPRPCAAAPDC